MTRAVVTVQALAKAPEGPISPWSGSSPPRRHRAPGLPTGENWGAVEAERISALVIFKPQRHDWFGERPSRHLRRRTAFGILVPEPIALGQS